MSLLAGRTVSFLTTASMEVLPNHGRTVTGGVRPWRSFMTTGRTGSPPGMGKMLLFKLITSECISLSEKTVNIFCREVLCRNQPKCPIKTSADSEQFHLTLTLIVSGTYARTRKLAIDIAPWLPKLIIYQSI